METRKPTISKIFIDMIVMIFLATAQILRIIGDISCYHANCSLIVQVV